MHTLLVTAPLKDISGWRRGGSLKTGINQSPSILKQTGFGIHVTIDSTRPLTVSRPADDSAFSCCARYVVIATPASSPAAAPWPSSLAWCPRGHQVVVVMWWWCGGGGVGGDGGGNDGKAFGVT